MSIPVLSLICQKCGEDFPVNPSHFAQLGFRALPKRCPTCADKAQGRPSVVVERTLLNIYDGVEIVSLPPTEEWQETKGRELPPAAEKWQETKGGKKDISAFRLTVKGSRYGASWTGRIDLFAPVIPKPGDVVSVREMESQHLIKVRREQRETLHYGTVTVEKELPVTADDPEASEVIRTRRYIVLEPFDGPAKCRLVWAKAHTKTTIKGPGLQYRAEIKGTPIAEWRVSGGVRSGRAYSVGILAIVDENHPLYIVRTGDIQGEECYK